MRGVSFGNRGFGIGTHGLSAHSCLRPDFALVRKTVVLRRMLWTQESPGNLRVPRAFFLYPFASLQFLAANTLTQHPPHKHHRPKRRKHPARPLHVFNLSTLRCSVCRKVPSFNLPPAIIARVTCPHVQDGSLLLSAAASCACSIVTCPGRPSFVMTRPVFGERYSPRSLSSDCICRSARLVFAEILRRKSAATFMQITR